MVEMGSRSESLLATGSMFVEHAIAILLGPMWKQLKADEEWKSGSGGRIYRSERHFLVDLTKVRTYASAK